MIHILQILKDEMQKKIEVAKISTKEYVRARGSVATIDLAIHHIMDLYDTIDNLNKAVFLRQKWYNEILIENTRLKREIQEHENGGPAKLPSVKPNDIPF
jgi:hypothetical protein